MRGNRDGMGERKGFDWGGRDVIGRTRNLGRRTQEVFVCVCVCVVYARGIRHHSERRALIEYKGTNGRNLSEIREGVEECNFKFEITLTAAIFSVICGIFLQKRCNKCIIYLFLR